MTITTKEFSDLLQYFSVKNASNHIISLALTVNDSFVVGFKQQTVTFEQPPWDILDGDNASTSSLFNQYIDNSSSLQYATNDTFLNKTQLSVKKRNSNLLVASTLFQNRRMRTITNVFLANLAISDMLLGVLCMPITLVGTYLRHFIFGELVCKFIQFAQAASVAVSSWTLVAISCERYYAICHPLRSRTWQTINHAYKIIGCIWFGSIVCMAPIAIFSQLIPTSRQGLRKCREQWPEEAVGYERFYNIFLDLVLLVLPLGILCVAYILITRTLYMGIKDEKALIFGNKNNNVTHGATGESKIYTQVEAEMKTPTVFNLNMSFRYQTRKGTASTLTGSGTVAGCVNNGDTLQTMKSATNNCRETKYCTSSSTGAENKYSAMGSISPSAAGVVYGRRGLCYDSSANIQAETEISFKETKEQSNNLQTQSTLRQHCNDDISQLGACSVDKTVATSAMTTANRRKFVTKSNDGRQLQLYCMRSASVKSLNRNSSKNKAERQDAASSSCYSLNTMPTTHITRLQPRQSFNQKQQQLQFHQQQQQMSGVVEKRKLNSMPSLRITESALRRSNLEKNLESKKRVVKMLFVLVLEFFICWTPLYVINTMAMFIGPAIYEYVDYTTISFFQLLAYSSSCCNPITYCFMNASFRRAFVDTFKGMHLNGGSFWHKSSKATTNLSVAGNSIAMANSCTVVTANTVLDSPRL
ncbi:5-hydroxytryptamine receptor 2A-like isoform X2 [Lucilia sericata]|uniref:5-hydroxytryptamine receptor 2A-like isoform X2 n=1 Tax=Lucilia sericata TaxID=13632 RepID=UPI0018A81399|nr:5-hydroxytryptamine receptor 2A-like isoform X2 [Lucilia sericata]